MIEPHHTQTGNGGSQDTDRCDRVSSDTGVIEPQVIDAHETQTGVTEFHQTQTGVMEAHETQTGVMQVSYRQTDSNADRFQPIRGRAVGAPSPQLPSSRLHRGH